MSKHLFRIVLLVSCAHALVHTFELSLPSIEQEIASEFFPDEPAEGKNFSGSLSNYWRLCWGIGALFAGILVDRFGAYRLLAIYLLGCGGACLASYFAGTQQSLMAVMVSMGAFASIYHPAGLALISNETNEETRTYALGIHGIFGSIGISSAPLIAAVAIFLGLTWREYYVVLAVPGIGVGLIFAYLALRIGSSNRNGSAQRDRKKADQNEATVRSSNVRPTTQSVDDKIALETPRSDLVSYFTLTLFATLQGFVYSAQMSFLPRYLSVDPSGDGGNSQSKLYASIALLLGCIGQYTSGRFAKHDRLEKQLMWITLANVPCIIAMGYATGWLSFVAAGLFAIVHFMHQPVYNSLIPKYTSPRHRSFYFGLSFAMGIGFGSFGARYAGASLDNFSIFMGLAIAALLGSMVAGLLVVLNRTPRVGV